MELLPFPPFGRAPAEAGFGAGAGALPNRAVIVKIAGNVRNFCMVYFRFYTHNFVSLDPTIFLHHIQNVSCFVSVIDSTHLRTT